MIMTQDEFWLTKWQDGIDFLETNHRKPSKFIPEKRNLRSWRKYNKKLVDDGDLKLERVARCCWRWEDGKEMLSLSA